MALNFNVENISADKFKVTDTAQWIADNTFVVVSGSVVNVGSLSLVALNDADAANEFVGDWGKTSTVFNLPVVGQNVGLNVDEVQTATITGTPTGGTFTLAFNAQVSGGIAYNAAASVVQSSLEALSTIGAGNVTVAGAAGGPYTVTFVGSLAATNVALSVSDSTGLTGGTSPTVTVVETTPGVSSSMAINVGDHVYINGTQLTENSIGVPFGIAFDAVAGGQTKTIRVLKD